MCIRTTWYNLKKIAIIHKARISFDYAQEVLLFEASFARCIQTLKVSQQYSVFFEMEYYTLMPQFCSTSITPFAHMVSIYTRVPLDSNIPSLLHELHVWLIYSPALVCSNMTSAEPFCTISVKENINHITHDLSMTLFELRSAFPKSARSNSIQVNVWWYARRGRPLPKPQC